MVFNYKIIIIRVYSRYVANFSGRNSGKKIIKHIGSGGIVSLVINLVEGEGVDPTMRGKCMFTGTSIK